MGAVHKVDSQMVQVLEHLLKLQHAGGTLRGITQEDGSSVLRMRGSSFGSSSPRIQVRPQLEEMLEFAYQRGRFAALVQSEAV
jgi:hypothetical protein